MTFWQNRPRKAIGEAKRVQVRTEEGFYPAFEGTLLIHKLDWWHNTIAQRSQPGWPDFTIFGDGWHAWAEIKARRPDGRIGKVSDAQERYKDSIERGGGEWVTFLLPDEWAAVDDWLIAKTGIELRGAWRR